MSSLFSLLLVLCLTMHACKARHLGIFDKESGRQVHVPRKEVEKVVRVLKTSTPSEVKPIHESQGGANTQKPKDSETLLKEEEKTTGKVMAVSQIKSLVSVSRGIPNEEHREDPGFDIDYSPPKIHPPSHN